MEIKKITEMGNCSCQQQIHNRQAKHFSYDFKTKNREEILNFLLPLTDKKMKK